MVIQREEANRILTERYGKDGRFSFATVEDGIPYARTVNAYYEDGAFYFISYGLSNKIRHISKTPTVAITEDWFTAHGIAKNLGYFCKEENKDIASKLRVAFAEWIDKGDFNFDDVNTIILRVKLTDGVISSYEGNFEFDFSN